MIYLCTAVRIHVCFLFHRKSMNATNTAAHIHDPIHITKALKRLKEFIQALTNHRWHINPFTVYES